ncbi:hypothetical protein ABTH20_19550, partial [Acinetobacter baumannii]
SFNEPANDPIEVGTSNHPYSDKSEDVETSSDEPYGNKNTKTKKSETTDNPPSRDERFDIQYIIQSLNHLTLDTPSPLERVYSIDILGNEIHG